MLFLLYFPLLIHNIALWDEMFNRIFAAEKVICKNHPIIFAHKNRPGFPGLYG